MGEKKRRLAAGSFPKSAADAKLDAQLASCREDCRKLEQFIATQPGNHEALYQLSINRHLMSVVHRERQHPPESVAENLNRALEAITDALSLHPHNDTYWVHFAECIKLAALQHPLTPRAHETLGKALGHHAVQPLSLITPIVTLVRSHPANRAFDGYLMSDQPSELERASGPQLLAAISEVFQEPLLLGLLQCCIVAEPAMERLIVLARRVILRQIVATLSATAPVSIEIIAAIAHQCFITEYLYGASALELSELDALGRAIQKKFSANQAPPLHWLAVHACYRPLATLQDAAKLTELASATPLAALVKRQITEPEEEKVLRATIPRAAASSNPVSTAVGSQYEDHPYPRWIKSAHSGEPTTFSGRLRQILPQATLAIDTGDKPHILIAGCGTGQHPIESVAGYRDADILAIDLSMASLAYAKRKTLELGIGNIEYQQRDILDLASLPQRFDLIESIGVLHHLEDPLRGAQVLRKLLKPRGLMRIALYSEIAREAIVKMREQIAVQQMQPTVQNLRRCRRQIRPMLETMGTTSLDCSPDFYCVSGCRDLFFHVMEHRFTLPEIARLLAELDLEFLAFQLPTVALAERYLAEFRDDPAMTNLANWHRFEQANPWMFQGMYFFWVQAKN